MKKGVEKVNLYVVLSLCLFVSLFKYVNWLCCSFRGMGFCYACFVISSSFVLIWMQYFLVFKFVIAPDFIMIILQNRVLRIFN